MDRLPALATVSAVVGALLSVLASLPTWAVAASIVVACTTVAVHLVLQYRQAANELKESRTARARLTLLEDEAVIAARSLPDPVQRTDVLLTLIALRQQPPASPSAPP